MVEIPSGAAAVTNAAPQPIANRTPPELWRTVFHIAWLAILLGFAIEALLLAAAAGVGVMGQPPALVADLVQKVSWSFLVCVGLGVGSAVAKNKPGLVALAGALAGPLAFGVARALHKSAAATLGLATGGGLSPFLVAALKGAQYGLFGWLVARLAQRPNPRPTAHAAVGLLTGAVFGGALIAITAATAAAPLTAGDVVSRGINEVLFPVGCALVLWTADALAEGRS